MKNSILIIIALGACYQTLTAQRAFEFSGTVGLGYSDYATPSPIVRMSDSIAVMVSPTHTVNHRDTIPRLMVLSDVHQGGALNQIFYHFFNPTNLGVKFNKPVRLDDTTACLFSEGPDGVIGSQDDGLNFIPNIDLPYFSQSVYLSLGQPGPSPDDSVHRVGDRWVAWPSRGPDREWDTGDEAVCFVMMDGVSATMITVPLNVGSGGCDGYTVTMGDGAFGLRLSGADRTYGTNDDEVARVSTTPGGSSPRVVTYAAGSGIHWPQLSPDWPKYAGPGRLAYPGAGGDGRLGTEDDELIVITELDGLPTHESRPVLGYRLWNSWLGPVSMGVEPDGALVFYTMGNDGWLGSRDDVLLWVTPTAASSTMDGNETLPMDQYLIWENEETIRSTVTLSGGSTILVTYGEDPRVEEFLGVLVVQKNNAGNHEFQHVPLGEEVVEIIPMGASAVLLTMQSGTVYQLAGLSGNSISLRPVPGLLAPAVGKIQSISPSVVVATRYEQPTTVNIARDVIQIWQVPTTFAFGQSTQSDAGYEMISDAEDRLPQTGNFPYTLILDSAPPSSAAWLMLSWRRSSLFILPGVEVLLDQEQFIGVYSWFTSYRGDSAIPVPVPSDPDLTGITWHSQWLVLDADEPRGFQLSDGLTIVF